MVIEQTGIVTPSSGWLLASPCQDWETSVRRHLQMFGIGAAMVGIAGAIT